MMAIYNPFDQTTEYLTTTISGPMSANGNTVLIPAPGANLRIVLTGVTLQNESTTALLIQLTNGVGGPAIERVLGQSQGNGLSRIYPPDARKRLSVNTALVINLSSASQCGVTVDYYVEHM